MKNDEQFMSRCIQLAKNGLGKTYPNPLVGSVIVYNNKIIGEGWHQKAGKAHAEVRAVDSVKNKDLLKESTIYVSLEPCSHFGKTPPCSDLIIASGIKNVIIGSLDPNPKVAGKGVQKLINAGCDVKTGVLEKECLELNKRFFTFHQKKRPYIILKWAQSADGFIAPSPEKRNEKKPIWISNSYSRQLVHKLRAQETAILIGTTTALQDNPSLTTRDWAGNSPIRIVLDKELKLPENLQIFDKRVKTILLTEKNKDSDELLMYETIDFLKMPYEVCRVLEQHQLQSVIIEGGTKIIQSFLDAELWDEAYIFTGPNLIYNGISAPQLNFSETMVLEQKRIQTDDLKIFRNS